MTVSQAEQIYLGLVREYRSAILNYLWRMVGDADLAEDLTQDTFVKAWRALDRLELSDESEARRRAWLYRIAHNTVTDHLRRKARLSWLPLESVRGGGGGDPEPGVLAGQPVRRALASLAEDQRQVLLLFSHLGLSATEVGEVLGISAAAARKRRQRARRAFAESWRAIGGELPEDALAGLRRHAKSTTEGARSGPLRAEESRGT